MGLSGSGGEQEEEEADFADGGVGVGVGGEKRVEGLGRGRVVGGFRTPRPWREEGGRGGREERRGGALLEGPGGAEEETLAVDAAAAAAAAALPVAVDLALVNEVNDPSSLGISHAGANGISASSSGSGRSPHFPPPIPDPDLDDDDEVIGWIHAILAAPQFFGSTSDASPNLRNPSSLADTSFAVQASSVQLSQPPPPPLFPMHPPPTLNQNFVIPYAGDMGLKIAVDGAIFVKTNKNLPASTALSLHPPGALYQDRTVSKAEISQGLRATLAYDMDAPLAHPRWRDGLSKFGSGFQTVNYSLIKALLNTASAAAIMDEPAFNTAWTASWANVSAATAAAAAIIDVRLVVPSVGTSMSYGWTALQIFESSPSPPSSVSANPNGPGRRSNGNYNRSNGNSMSPPKNVAASAATFGGRKSVSFSPGMGGGISAGAAGLSSMDPNGGDGGGSVRALNPGFGFDVGCGSGVGQDPGEGAFLAAGYYLLPLMHGAPSRHVLRQMTTAARESSAAAAAAPGNRGMPINSVDSVIGKALMEGSLRPHPDGACVLVRLVGPTQSSLFTRPATSIPIGLLRRPSYMSHIMSARSSTSSLAISSDVRRVITSPWPALALPQLGMAMGRTFRQAKPKEAAEGEWVQAINGAFIRSLGVDGEDDFEEEDEEDDGMDEGVE
uniref:Uncharacterized protein n=1 Tax=Polytomella parva TaxID=51329 RepID=A0A7S0V792_9CHLO|mmetsp:Transcript_3201/g.5277  ORF Transcript_3201/g.5277 Transcript_3201/m.5277 type:complete len:669 (+) Transcript_3201:976-2982(+)